ncbi:MAG: GNAT family N-acetyltransferase, partial [Rhizobiaceae bacterium]
HCDHLLVIDRSEVKGNIVGTYRLLLDDHAGHADGFYSEGEFDLAPLKTANRGKRLMELGRSCILPDYRSKRVMELLWQGTWVYALNNGVDVLFGCASFSGTDPRTHSAALSWLAQNATLDEGDCPSAASGSLPLSSFIAYEGNERRTVATLPPLLKGYLRLGAKISSQAVIDHQFDTIDVLVVLKVADINPRYLAHYGADASRFAS